MRRYHIATLMILVMVIVYHYLSGQASTGLTIDTATNKPLEYVHIGISGKRIGTISDEKGQFLLQICKDYQTDTLTFSMVGNRRIQFLNTDLLKRPVKLEMDPSIISLKGIVTRSKKNREQLNFGRVKPTKTTTGASEKYNYGTGQGNWDNYYE